jgi:hypothetical protein
MNPTLSATGFVRLPRTQSGGRLAVGLSGGYPRGVLGIVGTETPAPWQDKGGRPARDTAPQAGFRGVSDGTRTRDRLDHNQELYLLSYAHHVVALLGDVRNLAVGSGASGA